MTAATQHAVPEGDLRSSWRTLAWTSSAVFMVLLDATILFVAFPSIRRNFPAVSASDLSWILNAYTVVYAALLAPAGHFADRLGRRRVFLYGIAVFTFGSFVCLVAPSPTSIIAGRVVQAIGGAMLSPSSLALTLAAFPRSKWSIAISLWAGVGALAAAVGPSLGAAVIQLGGWRWVFLINLPIGIFVWSRSRPQLSESRDAQVEDGPDVLGIGLLMIGVGLVALGIVKAPEWHTVAFPWTIAGLSFVAWFISRSLDVRIPALDLSLFGRVNFRYANLATLIFGAAFSAMFLGGILFLTNVWGYNTASAGLGMTPGPLIVMVVAPLAGRLAARVGHRILLVPGGILFGLGYLLRWAATSPTPHYMTEWLPVVVVTGIAVGLVLPSLFTSAVHALPENRFGAGSAINQAIRQIGSVLGVAITVALVGGVRGADGMIPFSRLFLSLAAGGFLTALLSAPIDTRPVSHAGPSGDGSKDPHLAASKVSFGDAR